jgi:predicted CXXCH cytochrome family protein
MELLDGLKRFSFGAVVVALFTAGVASSSSAADDQAAKPSSPQEPSVSQYVGADTCKTCHEDIFNGLQKTRHWNTLLKTKQGDEAHSCETCHGPGAEHVNSGGDKTKLFTFKEAAPETVNKRCLECHSSGKDHMNFARSAHSENKLSCLSCHSSHRGMENQSLLIKTQPDLCYTCHQKVKPQFNMPFHHRFSARIVTIPTAGSLASSCARRQRGTRFATHAMPTSKDPLCSSTSRSRQRAAWPAIRRTVPQTLA